MKRWFGYASIALAFFTLGASPVGQALAKLVTPAAVNGCIYNTAAPALANGQSIVFQCDVNGKLITH